MRIRRFLLKLAGILMMFSSMTRFVFGLVFVSFYANYSIFTRGNRGLAGYAFVIFLLLILSCILELIAGIIGVINWNEPYAYRKCIIWGAVAFIAASLSSVFQIFIGYGASIITWLTGFIIPLLFLCLSVICFRLDGKP